MTRAALAQAVGCARSTITRACKEGGPLADATLDSGMVDAGHPAVDAWVRDRGGEVPAPELEHDPGPSGDEMRALTLAKLREDVRRLRLANEQTEGRLIPREPVRVYVMGHFDATHRRLLRDTPKSIAQRAAADVRAGEAIEAIEANIRDHIGAQLRSLKAQVTRSLNDAEKG